MNRIGPNAAIIAGSGRYICPKCQARPGQPCVLLAERRRGNHVVRHWPHSARVGVWQRREQDPRWKWSS